MTSSVKVFISHSSEEYEISSNIRDILEREGVTCWMAPDCIPMGSSHAVEIPKAIRECDAVVLILSQRAQKSTWVPKEINQAVSIGKTILPFQIEDCPLDDQFSYYLTNVQIFEAWRNWVQGITSIVIALHMLEQNKRGLLTPPQHNSPLYDTPAANQRPVNMGRTQNGPSFDKRPAANQRPVNMGRTQNGPSFDERSAVNQLPANGRKREPADSRFLLRAVLAAAAVVLLVLVIMTVFSNNKNAENSTHVDNTADAPSDNSVESVPAVGQEENVQEGKAADAPSDNSVESVPAAGQEDPSSGFSDPALQSAVFRELNISGPGELTPDLIESTTELNLSWKEGEDKIQDLKGLSVFTNLEKLELASQDLKEIDEIADLKQLTYINLEMNMIEDISPLQNLEKLGHIDLNDNKNISDISPLIRLTNATLLDLRNNHISDLRGISGMLKLERLLLSHNQITDLSPLAGLLNLTYLSFDSNQVVDITPVSGLVKLNTLTFSGNKVEDISPLVNLRKLRHLQISDNHIKDKSPLDELPDSVIIEDSNTQKKGGN